MATVNNVRLSANIINATTARLTIAWQASFARPEILAGMVFIYEVFIQNVDGVGDLDIRRRKVATLSDQANQTPINRTVTVDVDRNFLNEDFQVLGVGDTTDEWVAEVQTKVFTPSLGSGRSNELRMEFFPFALSKPTILNFEAAHTRSPIQGISG